MALFKKLLWQLLLIRTIMLPGGVAGKSHFTKYSNLKMAQNCKKWHFRLHHSLSKVSLSSVLRFLKHFSSLKLIDGFGAKIISTQRI
ncbi:MAG: hypothetical protein D6814_16045 [Calditrichaeota bacterium]|nr:MAG: hypothetical protein D6814_16045 [Calditrichota bacterium]